MKKITSVAVLSVVSLLPSYAHAAGFALNEESAAVLGTAFAGAAVSDEAAVMFSNPAGITGLQGQQVELGGTVYRIDGGSFQNQGTRSVLGSPVTGNSTSKNNTIEAASLYYTRPLNAHMTLGVGIYAPFGLVTTYDPAWVGRYAALDSHVNTTEINPVLAYKVNDQLSVGFGPTIRYTEAKLTQAVDFGSLGAANAIGGSVPQAQDGTAKIEGDGVGVGFKLGLTYKPTNDTTLGLGYRSRMTTRLEGSSHYTLSGTGATLSGITGAFVNTGARTDLNTPASADISVSHHLTAPLTLYGDVMWTGWSTFQQLEVSYDNIHQTTTVIPEKWKDTFRVSLGGSYDFTPEWTARMGYSFDQTPVDGAAFTTARVPDGDRHWLALGAGYKFSPALRVDAAYNHLFLIGGDSNNSVTSATTLIGTWDNISADLLTISATYTF